MTDEFAIRKIAQELIGLYDALEERMSTTPPREEHNDV